MFFQLPPRWRERAAPWLARLGQFFLGQGLAQAISFVGSLALLRWMEVEAYGVFTLAWSIQSMMMAVGDFGVGGAMVPIVGQRHHDPQAIGRVIAAARRLRLFLFPLATAFGAVGFWIVAREHSIAPEVALLLLGCALFAVWANATTLLAAGPLLLAQQIGRLQILQNAGAVLRVALYWAAHLAALTAAAMPLAVNCVVQTASNFFLGRWAAPLSVTPARGDPEVRVEQKRIQRFVLPQLPIYLFNTAQAQVTVIVASALGGTIVLAEVGALNRFSALFASVAVFYPWIVVPYFAKIEARLVARRTAQIVVAAITALTGLFALVWWFPEPFLWILGANYAHLDREMPWALLALSLGQVPGLLSAILFARRAMLADSILFIAIPVVGCQLLGAMLVPPSTTLGAMLLLLWANTGSLLGHGLLLARYLVTGKHLP